MRNFLVWILVLTPLTGCTPSRPERAQIYLEDGVHLFRCGAYADARQSFEAALKERPGDPTLLYNLAQCNEHLGAPDRAEKLYRDCIQRVPSHVDARHALDVLLVSQNRKRDAQEHIETWIERMPDSAAAYAEQAWFFQREGDLPKAEARLQQALQLDPDNVHALLEMGQLYELYQFPERALALYERAERVDPRHAEIQQRLARLRMKRADQAPDAK